jgi:AcrR family transcriptional regulator
MAKAMSSDNHMTTQRPRSQREQSLISSAYRVITRQGVHRTSLQDIADDAGVSKGLLVYHFKSKDVILITTMRWALERTAERIRSRLSEADGDARQAVRALVDAVFVSPTQNREFYLLYVDLVEHAARAPSFSELAPLTRQIINGLYAQILRDGIAHGAFVIDDVAETATRMRAYIDGIFLTWLQEEDWQATYSNYRQMCLNGLLRLLAPQ